MSSGMVGTEYWKGARNTKAEKEMRGVEDTKDRARDMFSAPLGTY